MQLRSLLITSVVVVSCSMTPEQEKLLQPPDNVNVVTSPDGRLRIYSWDDGEGGTMRYYRNVVEYVHGDKVTRTSLTSDPIYGDITDRYYTGIVSVPQIERMYLGVSYGRYSGCLAAVTINAFRLTDSGLDDTLRIFRDGGGSANAIGYGVSECEGKDPLDPLIYTSDMSSITIPVDGRPSVYRLIDAHYTITE